MDTLLNGRALMESLESRVFLAAPPVVLDGGLCAAAKSVYFAGYSEKTGIELWRSNGTTTTLVKDLRPGPGSSDPRDLVRAGRQLYFQVFSGAGELWTTRGTAQTTHRITRGYIPSMTPMGSSLLLLKAHLGHRELWITNGTVAGTRLLKDSLPLYTQVIGAGATTAFLVANKTIFVTDGTAAGTKAVYTSSTEPSKAFGLDNVLLFEAPDQGQPRLWAATASGAAPIGPPSYGPSTSHMIRISGKAYYLVRQDGVTQLWESDGTAAGTRQVGVLPVPHQDAYGDDAYADPIPMIRAANKQILAFYRYGPYDGGQVELWRVDPASAARKRLKTFTPVRHPDVDYPGVGFSTFAQISGGIVFNVQDDVYIPGRMFVSDATVAGTKAVTDQESFEFQLPANVDGKVFFIRSSPDRPSRLWVWDYTAQTPPRRV